MECEVCGHSAPQKTHRCRFEKGCSCWRGKPCRKRARVKIGKRRGNGVTTYSKIPRKNPPKFTRQDFQWIADTIRISVRNELGSDIAMRVAEVFARDLKETNANFNRERFMKAVRGTAALKNPVLVTFGNPRKTRRNPGTIVATGDQWSVMSDNVTDIGYQHKDDGQYYRHKFRKGQVRLVASAGSPAAMIRRNDGKPLVKDY